VYIFQFMLSALTLQLYFEISVSRSIFKVMALGQLMVAKITSFMLLSDGLILLCNVMF